MTFRDSFEAHLKKAGWNKERLINMQTSLDLNAQRIKDEQLQIHQGEYPPKEIYALQRLIKEKKEVIKDTRKEITRRLSVIKQETKKTNMAARNSSPYKAFKEAAIEILPNETIKQIEARSIQLMKH